MRIYRTHHNNENFEPIDPHEFPHVFAVCRSINPYPQFQLVRIERVRGYDEQAHYVFFSEPIENVESVLIHDGNAENRQYGQMFVLEQINNNRILHQDFGEPIRIGFEIRNIFLVTRNEHYPVVVLDNPRVLPNMDAALIPRNCSPNRIYTDNDAYFIMNYLMDRRNFSLPDMMTPIFQPGLMNIERLRRDTRRRSTWFDDDRYIRNYRRNSLREAVIEEERNNFSRGGGGGGEEDRTRRRRERPQTPPPETPPRAIPRDASRVAAGGGPAAPITLQAFTISALINHAVSENMTCPISMNPIQKSTACVTSCQHIFERDSITRWLSDHRDCPVCRQRTAICN